MTKTTGPKALTLPATQAKRCAQMMTDTAKLATLPPSPDTFTEAMELGRATMERMTALQKGWAQDWIDWANYASTISGADTLPKFADRAGNIAVRAQTQMTNQITAMSELSENASVSYSFWVAQQLKARGIDTSS